MTTKPKARKFRIRRSGPVGAPAAAPEGQAPLPETAPKPAPTSPEAQDEAIMARASGQESAQPAPADTATPATPRGGAARRKASAEQSAGMFDTDSAETDGFGDKPFPGSAAATTAAREGAAPAPEAQSGEVTPNDETSIDATIDAIRKEGLTGRQLRMARRVAQKHGLAPTSDFDAVRLLRGQGIDPFQRATMLELVVPEGQDATAPAKLPQTVAKSTLPGAPAALTDASHREEAIAEIQRDIARRRRRKAMLLFTRLGFFVGLPTLLCGIYFATIATPLYATKSEFVIQQSEAASSPSLGGLFSGTGFATSQDSITVQSFLQSRAAMLRLDDDIGFKSHFQQEWIDPIQRLPENATNEQAYKTYARHVTIGYDPSEGIIKLEVVAADPEVSADFSRALISYAEEQVDQLTQRLREDQMAGARDSFTDAEAKMIAAQNRVLELQTQLGVLDPASESSALMGQITNFETQLGEKRLQLQQLLDNARPNQARVDGVRGDIQRLETLIAQLRAQLTNSGTTTNSLAKVTSELRIAELDLQTRQLMMQQALQQLETARIEANRQTRYLSMGVIPVATDEPSYPKRFENTLLAFLIFSGLYLMISLTVSILREQVSN